MIKDTRKRLVIEMLIYLNRRGAFGDTRGVPLTRIERTFGRTDGHGEDLCKYVMATFQ